MSSAPTKPAGVPEGAMWVDADQEWEFGPELDGKRHGQFIYWRPDGSLCNLCHYAEGLAHGPFYRFHESGELSQRGTFVRGKMHGVRHCYRATGATTERSMEGMSDSVSRTEIHYDMDAVLRSLAFDAEGRLVCDDGSPLPERPGDLPADARFDAREKVWQHGETRLHPDGKVTKEGLWRWWTAAGVLLRETSFADDQAYGPHRELYPDGKPKVTGEYERGDKTGTWETWREDGTLQSRTRLGSAGKIEESFAADGRREAYAEEDADGRRDGAYETVPEEGQLAVPGVARIKGEYTRGRMSGTWELSDDHGVTLWRMPLGQAEPPETFADHPLLADATLPANDLRIQLFHALSESRVGDAMLAGVRLAGAGDVSPLQGVLAAFQIPNVEDYRRGYSQYLIRSMDLVMRSATTDRMLDALVPAYVDAIFQGADAPSLLRSLAICCDQHQRSWLARDLITAALGLAPERQAYRFTEALVHMSLGDVPAADAAIAALSRAEPEQGQYLAQYLALVSAPFTFWPSLAADDADTEGAAASTLDHVRTVDELTQAFDALIARLARARDELIRRGLPADASWMVPDLGDTHVPAAKPGGQTFAGIDYDASVPDLLAVARSDWFVLCLLVGATGAGGIQSPQNAVLPAAAGLARAVQHWVQACEGTADGPYTGPMILWNGLPLEGLDPRLVGIILKVPTAGAYFIDWLTHRGAALPWAMEDDGAADEEDQADEEQVA